MMRRLYRIPFGCYLLLALGGSQPIGLAAERDTAAQDAARSAEAFFNETALPVLKQHCYECHSHAAGKAKGGLVLDSRSGWAQGGDSGPAIVPGKPEESLLIQAVRYGDLEMPPSGKLPPGAIAALERWVADGAFDPRTTEAIKAQTTIDLEAGRKHWAFQPLQAAAPPAVHDTAWPLDDADRFLLAKLESQALRPAAEADRYTWLRRVSLDLTGLPPTPAQIAAFIADASPQACERVVDRLLASQGFGERWGRHWLDLTGYADQIGTANDIFAAHAWRYRDYVIAAFNADKPYDAFIREQLAGDLLPFASSEECVMQLTATGFLLLGDLPIVEADKAKLRVDVIDQQVDKIGRAFLGMTLACARCHDHKFDPIPQRDYYALAGILNSTASLDKAPWGIWSWPSMAELPETESQQTERAAQFQRHRARLEGMKAERSQLQARVGEVDAALKNAASANDARAVLEKVKQDLTERVKKLDGEIVHAEFFAPAPAKAYAVREAAEPADMQITIRGNPHALGDRVPRGFLQVASSGAAAIPAGQSGRRQLADWIAAPGNPLTARVAVNRVWQKLFGEGLVRSVDYFGLPGERPSHPELLDHVAQRFIAGGWSHKRLIRALVLSRAYRMSSEGAPSQSAADPDNRLLARMNRRRLDAESLRDALLAASGRLMETSGGPSLPLEYLENTGNLAQGNVNPPSFRLARFRPEQQFERTVYLPIMRSAPQAGPSEVRNVFDFTQPAEFAGQRAITAVPTQALFLMNSSLIKDRSRDLAERLVREGADEQTRLELMWLRVYNRPILDVERVEAASLLASLRGEAAGGDQAGAETRAWAELCQALFASNEFLLRM